MLTFEKILKVFQAYLDDDPLYFSAVPVIPVGFPCHQCITVAGLNHLIQWIIIQICPVSYTHLDVYKRQTLLRCREQAFFSWCRSWVL